MIHACTGTIIKKYEKSKSVYEFFKFLYVVKPSIAFSQEKNCFYKKKKQFHEQLY